MDDGEEINKIIIITILNVNQRYKIALHIYTRILQYINLCSLFFIVGDNVLKLYLK